MSVNRIFDICEAPPLFLIGSEGDGQLVDYRVRQNYYIVDRLFAAAELGLGGENQQSVGISRTDGRLCRAKTRKGSLGQHRRRPRTRRYGCGLSGSALTACRAR